jgi:hypothetical protein
MTVPMKSIAGRRPTVAFHRPISRYVNALAAAGFPVDAMVELPDFAPNERPRPAARGSRNPDIPLFLAMRGVRRRRTGSG